MGGPSAEQEETYKLQNEFTTQLMGEYSTLFSENQGILSNLTSTFTPILDAGPSQEGFSAGEKSTLNSQAIQGTAQTYQAAEQGLQSNLAGEGGGGEVALPSGGADQLKEELATSAASNESNNLLGIQQADYQQGYQNWLEAAQELGQVSSLTNPEGQASVTNQASGNQGTTANEITQADNSWMGVVGGILGGATSNLSFTKGGMTI